MSDEPWIKPGDAAGVQHFDIPNLTTPIHFARVTPSETENKTREASAKRSGVSVPSSVEPFKIVNVTLTSIGARNATLEEAAEFTKAFFAANPDIPKPTNLVDFTNFMSLSEDELAQRAAERNGKSMTSYEIQHNGKPHSGAKQ